MSNLRERLEELKSIFPNIRLNDYAKAVTLATEAIEENERLREALKECEIGIDACIDDERPLGVHPKWDKDNAYWKANNPARIALEGDQDS